MSERTDHFPAAGTEVAGPARCTPPGLLLAALLFWGWQADWLWVGAVMGLGLELPRWVPFRWELQEADFRRLWNFSFLLGLGVMIYLFANDNPPGLAGAGTVASKAGLSSLNAGVGLLRLLPAVWFFFIAAQVYSTRQAAPLGVISWLVRRWQRSAVPGEEAWANLTYPYFMVCIFSASVHPGEESHWYFPGQAALFAWALWPLRARRAAPWVWVLLFAVALAAGYGGAHGIGRLEQFLNSYNARWMTSFIRSRQEPDTARTSLGVIGQLKLSGGIVLRVEPLNGAPVPTYLREASFNKYGSTVWQAAGPNKDFTSINHENTNDQTWVLLPGRTNLAALRIAAWLDSWSREIEEPKGILPLPAGCARLEELPAHLLEMNSLGTMVATGPGLIIYQTLYGSGPGSDRPPDTNWDRQVPANETAALDQVIAQEHLAGQDYAHTLQAVQGYFASRFTYTLRVKPVRLPGDTNGTPVSDFLLHTHAGYCEYFATATVLMLRRLNVPARYATGFVVHERSGQQYVVREHDAHAWCLVWNPQQQSWEDFDTTPASADPTGGNWAQGIGDAWSWVKFQIARFRWGQAQWRQYLLWFMVPVLVLSLFQILYRRGRSRASRGAGSKGGIPAGWPGRDSEFYRLEARLASRGVPRQAGESLAPWLERVLAEPALAGWGEPVRELLRLHYIHRFDPQGLDPAGRERLARETAVWLERLESSGRGDSR